MNKINYDTAQYLNNELPVEYEFNHTQAKPTRFASADGLKDIEKKPRTPGYWKDRVRMSEDFDDPLPAKILVGFGA